MNRRIRNRTYGGVGGREPRGSLLPDYYLNGLPHSDYINGVPHSTTPCCSTLNGAFLLSDNQATLDPLVCQVSSSPPTITASSPFRMKSRNRSQGGRPKK